MKTEFITKRPLKVILKGVLCIKGKWSRGKCSKTGETEASRKGKCKNKMKWVMASLITTLLLLLLLLLLSQQQQ